MKKAFAYLEAHNIDYDFYDYKKLGIDDDVIQNIIQTHGWENVINRRGTTWRKLSEDVRNLMDDVSALQVARDNPSILKRPILIYKQHSYLGFKEEIYKSIFA